jgi:peptide/nickel transport system permease protein
MLKIVRDLFRYNREFAIGTMLAVLVLGMAGCRLLLALSARRIYVVPPDMPPSWAHPFGTNSRGQDVFWQLTFALRNTLLFGFAVAILSRILSLLIGLTPAIAAA